MFVFLVLHKNDQTLSWSSIEYLSAYKTSWFHIRWCKFCVHLRSLSVLHFGVVEGSYSVKRSSIEVP
jgi:hypothetical protein